MQIRYWAVWLALLSAVLIDAFSQEISQQLERKQAPLFASLHNENRQWTMNHIYVLEDVAAARRYTNQEFADAILEFIKFRWDTALEKSDKTFFLLGYITHTIIDLHWPGRLERNATGQIVRFKTCAELGGSAGIRSEEESPSAVVRNDSTWKQKAVDVGTKLLRTYKEQRPFSEISAYLRGDLLMMEPGREGTLLGEGR